MRINGYIAAVLFAGASLVAPPVAFAQQQQTDLANQQPDAQWYLTGDMLDTDHLSFAANQKNVDLSYDPVARSTRVEMGLTFSNSSDVERIGFANGQSIDLETADDSYTFLVSGAYDVDTGTSFTPHFMAGLGLSYSDLDNEGTDLGLLPSELSRLKPALQMGMGATYSVNEAFAFSASYRAFFLGDQLFDTALDTERTLTHNFMLGAKIKF